MNLSAYDDVMGLEFGDMSDIDGLLNPEMLKEALIASTAGGAAILLAGYGIKKATTAVGLETKITNPVLRAAVVSAVTMLGGVAIGRGLYDYNREAAIGIVGSLGGIAMASFLDTVIAQVTGNARLMPGLGEDDGSSYDSDGTAALAMLEATNVSAAPGAFNGLADPTVTQEQLMGFESTMVEQETLGGYNAYMA
jgi:hypothetical protein